jgi:hypothetical protein
MCTVSTPSRYTKIDGLVIFGLALGSSLHTIYKLMLSSVGRSQIFLYV